MKTPSSTISPRAAAPRPGSPPCGGDGAAQPPSGLVQDKTSQTQYLEVAFDTETVQRRRLGRLRRTLAIAATWHTLTAPKGQREQVWFVTLTYVGVDDWRPGHISACTDCVRKWCSRQGVPFKYVWVAELQRRGAVHYHLALWLPKRLQLPKFDKRGWWPHGLTQTVIGRSPVGYLMKYLSKTQTLQAFPKGVRIHGYGGLHKQGRQICSWLNQPEWCKQQFGVGELRTIKGRRVVRSTGEILVPMYTRVRTPAGMRLYPNGPLPDRWADGAYSSVSFH